MTIEGLTVWAVDMPAKFKDEARVVWWISACEELLAWHYRAVFHGFTCRKRDDSWLLVVKVRARLSAAKPEDQVAFFAAQTFWECWRLFAHQMHNGTVSWKKDKYR